MKNKVKRLSLSLLSVVLAFTIAFSSSAVAFASKLISEETTAKSVEIAYHFE